MKNLRDAGRALSLANLLFYPVWAELLPGCYGHYYLKNPPALAFNLGMLAVVSAIAVLLWFGIRLPRAGKVIFMVFFLWAFNGIRYHLLRFAPIIPFDQQALFGKIDLFLLRPLLLAGVLLLLTKWRGRVVQAVEKLVLILLPFVVVTFSQAAWASVKLEAGLPFRDFADQPPAPLLPTKPGGTRILWFLFDGSDQRLMFSERSPDLQLPNLDRLRKEAVYASNAHSPATNTRESLPALLTGIQNVYVCPVRANDLLIRHDNTGVMELWSTQPNIFSKARARGYNTALVGYYHPYSRIIGRHLSKCVWSTGSFDPMGVNEPDATLLKAIPHILAREADRLWVSTPFIWRLDLSRPPGNFSESGVRNIPDHLRDYLDVREEAEALVPHPAFQLIFVHWPIPHAPFIYDHRTGRFSADRPTDYAGNLALMDRTIGEIRAQLEAAGLWDGAALVITSDHAWERRAVSPVPFLLKLPGQKKGIEYPKQFNTLVTSELLLQLLSGNLTDPRDAIAWMDQHHDPTE